MKHRKAMPPRSQKVTKHPRKRHASALSDIEKQDGSEMEPRKKQKTGVQVAKKKVSASNEKEGDTTSILISENQEGHFESTPVSDVSTMKIIPAFGKTSTGLQSGRKETPSSVQVAEEDADIKQRVGDDINNENGEKCESLPKLEDTTKTCVAGNDTEQKMLTGEDDIANHSAMKDEDTNLMTASNNTKVGIDEKLTEVPAKNDKVMIGEIPQKKVVDERSAENEGSAANDKNGSRAEMIDRTINKDTNVSGEAPVPATSTTAADCQIASKISEMEYVRDSAEQGIISTKTGVMEDKRLTEVGQEIKQVEADGGKDGTEINLEAGVSKEDDSVTGVNAPLEASGVSVKAGGNDSDVCSNSQLMAEAAPAHTEDNFAGCVDPMDLTSSQLLQIEAVECGVVHDDFITIPTTENNREAQSTLHQTGVNQPASDSTSLQRGERQGLDSERRGIEVMRKMMKDLTEIKLITGSLLTQMSQYRKHRSQRQPQPSAFVSGNQSTSGQSFQRKPRGSTTSQFKKY